MASFQPADSRSALSPPLPGTADSQASLQPREAPIKRSSTTGLSSQQNALETSGNTSSKSSSCCLCLSWISNFLDYIWKCFTSLCGDKSTQDPPSSETAHAAGIMDATSSQGSAPTHRQPNQRPVSLNSPNRVVAQPQRPHAPASPAVAPSSTSKQGDYVGSFTFSGVGDDLFHRCERGVERDKTLRQLEAMRNTFTGPTVPSTHFWTYVLKSYGQSPIHDFSALFLVETLIDCICRDDSLSKLQKANTLNLLTTEFKRYWLEWARPLFYHCCQSDHADGIAYKNMTDYIATQISRYLEGQQIRCCIMYRTITGLENLVQNENPRLIEILDKKLEDNPLPDWDKNISDWFVGFTQSQLLKKLGEIPKLEFIKIFITNTCLKLYEKMQAAAKDEHLKEIANVHAPSILKKLLSSYEEYFAPANRSHDASILFLGMAELLEIPGASEIAPIPSNSHQISLISKQVIRQWIYKLLTMKEENPEEDRGAFLKDNYPEFYQLVLSFNSLGNPTTEPSVKAGGG